jgi:hypothetical protein
MSNDEVRMSNFAPLFHSQLALHISHFGTVAERAFVAQRLGRVNIASGLLIPRFGIGKRVQRR